MNPTLRLVPLALTLALIGCESSAPLAPSVAGPAFARAGADSRAPRHVHRAPTTPPFLHESESFTVIPGQAGEGHLTFADGSPFVTFLLPAGALVGATVNGVPVAAGQPLTITLRRVDASRFYVEFEPAGLVFNPDAQPEIVFDYTHAQLPRGTGALEVWKQDRRGEQWTLTETEDDRTYRQARGRVGDFSAYTLSIP